MTPVGTDRLVTSMLSGGLTATEAERLVETVAKDGRLDVAAKRELARLSEKYRSFFTRPGAQRWKKLTGIDVSKDEVEYPTGFLPRQSLLELRTAVAQGITGAITKTSPGRPRAASGAGDDAIIPRPTDLSWSAKLSGKIVRELAPPTRMLEAYLAAVDAPVIRALVDEVTRLERCDGDNNGVLVPRDLTNASATIRGLMEQVYRREGGRKSLPLSRVETRLRRVAASFLNGKTVRTDPQHAAYTQLVREAVAWLAQGYADELLRGQHQTTSAYFASRGLNDSRAFSRLLRLVPQVRVAPTEAEAAALWQGVKRRELSSSAFTDITQMSVAEARALEQRRPELFAGEAEKDSGATNWFRGSQQNAATDFAALVTRWVEEDVLITREQLIARANHEPAFVDAWGSMSVARYKTWQRQFPELFPDLRSVDHWAPVLTAEIQALVNKQPGLKRREVLALLQPRHPGLREHHLETVSARTSGLFTAQGRTTPVDREAQAKRVGAMATAWVKADPLLTRDDIVDRVNRDAAYVKAFGKLTFSEYQNLGHRLSAAFPKLRDRNQWMPVIKAEIERLKDKRPGLGRAEAVELLKPKYPNLNLTRINDLCRVHRDLFTEHRERSAETREVHAKLVKDIARLLRRQPSLTIAAIVEELSDAYPQLTARVVGYVRKKFAAELPQVAPLSSREVDTARETQTVHALYHLLLRLFPPGTTQDVVLAALNEQLGRRGVPPFNSKVFQATRGSSLDVFAEVAARLVAEYATAAPQGVSEDQILDAIAADYPTLTRMGLRHVRRRWQENPAQFPALAPFVGRGEDAGIQLVGLGKTIAAPRYLGGWTLERAVLAGSPAERRELQELAQQARIPLHLPMLDQAVADLKGGQPLATKNLLVVSHFLASTVPLALALKQAGAVFENTVMVGTPYGSNRTVVETLRRAGFDIRVPALAEQAYKQEVEKALDAIAERQRQNGQSVVVLDDGGLVADLLHTKAKYADVIGAFKLVEQTTGGIIQLEKHALQTPVINVARSKAKAPEAPLIGKAVATKVRQGVEHLGRSLAGQRAVVIGYGSVGREVARELRDAGAYVTVVEASPTRREQAKTHGFGTAGDVAAQLDNADLVIGCTGTRSLTVEQMRRLKSGAVIASASSKRKEFEMDGLAALATEVSLIPSPIDTVTLPSRDYQLGRKHLIVLGDGWPVNFDGDVEDIAPEKIQLTRALMFTAALQACRLQQGGKNVGLIPFDPQADRELLERFARQKQADTGVHPLRDPAAWESVLRDLTDSLNLDSLPGARASNERARARYLAPKVQAWLAADPLLKQEDLVRLANADPEHTRRFGELTYKGYKNLKQHGDLPDLRTGSAWIPVLLEEVRALMARHPRYLRKDLLRELKIAHPNIKKHHVDILGRLHPDVVPNARPELRR